MTGAAHPEKCEPGQLVEHAIERDTCAQTSRTFISEPDGAAFPRLARVVFRDGLP